MIPLLKKEYLNAEMVFVTIRMWSAIYSRTDFEILASGSQFCATLGAVLILFSWINTGFQNTVIFY